MNIGEVFQQLWHTTGIYNFVQPADPNITNVCEQLARA